MKLSNIFKKASKTVVATSNVQKLDKSQLSKVIGGGDPTAPSVLAATVSTTRSNTKDNY